MTVRKFLLGSFIGLFVFMVFGCGSTPSSSTNATTGMDLDEAIKNAAIQMETRIPSGTMVALVSLASPSNAFSTQVLTRLESAIVSSGKLIVVDRANLDKVRAEQGFQLSGEVSDESAKAIGQLLGAGAIVTGSITDLGDVYSLTLKAINIETATVAVSYLADLAKTTRIETLLASRDGAASGGTTPAQTPTVPAQTQVATPTPAPASVPATPVYKIGDTGPAGGIIFYDKGNNSGGWRYLEAAPASTEGKDLQWSVSNFDTNAKGVDVGNGKQNTRNIMEASVQAAINAPAARYCDRLEYGGYDDWYLPSKNELGLMYMNLRVDGIGGLSAGFYWSSSESGGSTAWNQRFSDGFQGSQDYYGDRTGRKTITYSVRAIRQF